MRKRKISKTEMRLIGWVDDDFDIENEIHVHFTEREPAYILASLNGRAGEDIWAMIAEDGTRIHNLMFPTEQFAEDSAEHALHVGIAAASYDLAIALIARQLGLVASSVIVALETDRVGDPDGFIANCKEQEQRDSDAGTREMEQLP